MFLWIGKKILKVGAVRKLPLWTLVCLFVSLCFATPAWALEYQSLQDGQDGLEYTKLQIHKDNSTQLHLLRVDLKKFKVKVIEARELHSKTLSVKAMAKQTQALAAINANFFDENDQPLGLIVSEGQLKNPSHFNSWYAALVLKGEKAKVVKFLDTQTAKDFETIIQAGPRLVIKGKVPKLKSETSPKSAVGIDPAGKLILIASEGSIEINELAKMLAESETKGGVGLVDVLNLDGGSSTQFFAKSGRFEVWIPGINPVPVALGIYQK